VKIVDAVRVQAQRNGGHYRIQVSNEEAIIQVDCAKGHQWTNDFRPRQGQKWCRECRREQIAQEKESVRRQEEEEQQRIADEQEQMFAQAREQFAFIADIDEKVAAVIETDPDVRFIQQVVDAIVKQGDAAHVAAGTGVDPDD